MNAHFVLRIATDRDWAADVRAQVKPFKQFCLSWIQFFHLYCESLPSALSGSLNDLKHFDHKRSTQIQIKIYLHYTIYIVYFIYFIYL